MENTKETAPTSARSTFRKSAIVKGLSSRINSGSVKPHSASTVSSNLGAFGTKSIRFTYKKEEEDSNKPGPADYNLYKTTLYKDNPASNSRKGFGSLTSKVFRDPKLKQFYHTTPGPGKYENLTASYEKSAKGFSIPLSEYDQNTRPTTSKLLGPGTYSGENESLRKSIFNHNVAGVVMKSKSRRTEIQEGYPGKDAPRSTRYFIERTLSSNRPMSVKGMSAFCQPTYARNVRISDYRQVKDIIDGVKRDKIPGPGTYEHDLPQSHPSYSLKENMAVESTGVSFIPKKETPGPGRYDMDGFFDGQKFLAYHSPFMSTTVRKTIDIRPASGIHAPFSLEYTLSKKNLNKSKLKNWI